MKIAKIIGWGILMTGLFTLFGIAYAYVVMYLWNWLVPEIFNGPIISFWQTAGLILLVKLFVGFSRGWGWGGNYKHYMWKQKMKEKFGHMSPEEKMAFKQEMKARWSNRWGTKCEPYSSEQPNSDQKPEIIS